MDLGAPARDAIKRHDLAFYLNALREAREQTWAEFKNSGQISLIRGRIPGLSESNG